MRTFITSPRSTLAPLTGKSTCIPTRMSVPGLRYPLSMAHLKTKAVGGELPSKIVGGPVLSDVVLKRGGGGGGFGIIFPYNPPEPDLDITTGTGQMVAATAAQAIEQVLDLSAKIGGQVFPGPHSAPVLLSSNSKL
jgi:hypothetical protein